MVRKQKRTGSRLTRRGSTRLRLTYDAWNRLTQVESWKDADEDGVQDEGEPWGLVAVYQYDGLSRRTAKIVRQVAGETVTYNRTDYYYNEAWRVLEERTDTFEDLEGEGGALETPAETPNVQWLWDARYIDAPVLRWRDADLDSETGYLGLEETLYACNDANMNVTALIDPATGEAVERYVYDAYGKATVCDEDWTPRQGNTSAYASEILYSGYRFDAETGLYQVRFRYYHPTLGRWTGRGPADYQDGMGLYQYARSDPATSLDPTGLWGKDIHYDLTLELAQKARIICARAVAEGAERPDEDPERRPGLVGVWDIVSATLFGVTMTTAKQKVAQIAEWHFPASDDGEVHPDSAKANAKVDNGIHECDFKEFSEGLHVLQDSWAHQGKPYVGGIGHGRGAVRSAFFGWTKLQGFDAAISPSADDVTLWPEDVRATGLATYRELKEFKDNCKCACPPLGPFASDEPNNPTSYGPARKDAEIIAFLDSQFPGQNVVR
jgi:RHS repeat-associated protein